MFMNRGKFLNVIFTKIISSFIELILKSTPNLVITMSDCTSLETWFKVGVQGTAQTATFEQR
jgi:hypothetical protein